jgi:hypothetical protein
LSDGLCSSSYESKHPERRPDNFLSGLSRLNVAIATLSAQTMTLPHDNWNIQDIDVESDYKDFLEDLFSDHGWTVLREQPPAGTDYSADMLIEHDELGWFGIEAKVTNYGGRQPAAAHHQIVKKYRGRMYIGHRIDRWVYAPFYQYPEGAKLSTDIPDPQRQSIVTELVCPFFSKHGIGYLDPFRWVIKFQLHDPKYTISIQDEVNHTNIDKIDSYVDKQMQEYSYR